MAVVVEILKELVKKQFNEKMIEIEHEVDCIVEDIRKAKSPGLNTKKAMENIEEAARLKGEVDKTKEDAERIYKALVIVKTVYDATDKSTTIGAALNPVAAAIGYATRFLIEAAKKEIRDLKNIIEVIPSLSKNFGEFLKRSRGRIIVALAAAALKQKSSKDRTNMVG
jgi:hypothetical protein|tara:strand:+ start:1724 stop:2227 length:504 start_codon:yes stop_codon:yes gene_type:complete